MKKSVLIFFSIVVISVKVLAGGDIQPDKRVLKDAEKIFGMDPAIAMLHFPEDIKSEVPNLKESDRVYSILGAGGRSGYLLITSAKGRYDLFDYSIVFSDSLSVLGVWVTRYRSSHGGAICGKGWLTQFQGYKGEKIELGKEIDSISGATFSASSMVADMKRCHEVMVKLGKMGLLY